MMPILLLQQTHHHSADLADLHENKINLFEFELKVFLQVTIQIFINKQVDPLKLEFHHRKQQLMSFLVNWALTSLLPNTLSQLTSQHQHLECYQNQLILEMVPYLLITTNFC